MKRLFGCFVLICCWISFSQAHEVRPAFLKVTETNLETDRSEFEISLPVEKNKIFGFILTSIFLTPKVLKAKICDD